MIFPGPEPSRCPNDEWSISTLLMRSSSTWNVSCPAMKPQGTGPWGKFSTTWPWPFASRHAAGVADDRPGAGELRRRFFELRRFPEGLEAPHPRAIPPARRRSAGRGPGFAASHGTVECFTRAFPPSLAGDDEQGGMDPVSLHSLCPSSGFRGPGVVTVRGSPGAGAGPQFTTPGWAKANHVLHGHENEDVANDAQNHLREFQQPEGNPGRCSILPRRCETRSPHRPQATGQSRPGPQFPPTPWTGTMFRLTPRKGVTPRTRAENEVGSPTRWQPNSRRSEIAFVSLIELEIRS